MYKINWRDVQRKNVVKKCRYVKFKGTVTKRPVQKPSHKTTKKKHVEHHDATYI